MKNRIKILLSLLLCSSFIKAQINPADGSMLNYTQVMLEYESVRGATEYLVEIAYDSQSGFDNSVLVQRDNSTATLISNLSFGKKYMWRYMGIIAGMKSTWKGPYKFEITQDPAIDAKLFQCRVLQNDTSKNGKGVMSLDYAKLIVERKGNPIWYLPQSNKLFNQKGSTRDLRITDAGTILFIAGYAAFECDLNANILWQAPDDGKVSADTIEYYHHDFKKLSNGNYMILGEKFVWRNVPKDADISKFKPENVDTSSPVARVKFLFGTIIEYNKDKKVVWSWNSGDYFSDKDIFSNETSTNNPRRDLPANAEIFGHLNAFDVDSTGTFVYAGFRDISRIVKIDKSTGNVIDSWGLRLPSGEAKEANDFFKNQHDLTLLPDNDLLVFNNNGLREVNNSSQVVEFSQRKENQPVKITWMFDCKFDTLTNGKTLRNGGVDYLENTNFLICMGTLSRVTEVTKVKKEIVWDAFVETRDAETSPWSPLALYHVHYSSSLYPCYFTAQLSKDSTAENPTSFNVTVFNEGTNADSYNIEIKSPQSRAPQYVKSGTVTPGKSKTILISLKKELINTGPITALVSSKTNPDKVKKLQLNFNR